ncbi:MAG: DNA-methyltransferase [Promethearchaeota archaeon]
MKVLNKIFCQDARSMTQLGDASVNLMVTSPPYNVTKQYDEDLSLKEYLNLIEDVHKEVYRVLVPGGFIGLNIANVGRKPYIPLDCYFIEILEKLGFEIIQEIVWDKGASAGQSCAWGSWQSASNPSLRDVHEYIIIARKPPNDETQNIISHYENIKNLFQDKEIIEQKLDPKKIQISNKELFSNLWRMGTASAKRIGHPAPFSVELPYRLILLFSKEGDIVLDPFMGSGSTAIAAIISKRNYIGYEIKTEYVALCERRIDEFLHPEKRKKRLKRERALKQKGNLGQKALKKGQIGHGSMKKSKKTSQSKLLSYIK